MAGQDPYEVLGVATTADAGEIRRAYLRAARRNHPDVAGPTGEQRMREINGAWAILGDAAARQRFDETRRTRRVSGDDAPINAGFTINPLDDRPFVPYDDGDDDDDWRFEPDEFDPATAPSALMRFLPVGLIVGAVVIGALGTVMSLLPLVGAALVLGALGCVSFVVAPLVAMGKASAHERRDH